MSWEPNWSIFWKPCFCRIRTASHTPRSRWLNFICLLLLFSFDRTLNRRENWVFLVGMRTQLSILSWLVTLIRKNPAKHMMVSEIISFFPPVTHVKLANKPWSCAYLMINLCYFVVCFFLNRFSHARFTALQNFTMLQCCLQFSRFILKFHTQ